MCKKPVFRIWMDSGFFADPDPDFKNPISLFFAFNILNYLMGLNDFLWLDFEESWSKNDGVDSD